MLTALLCLWIGFALGFLCAAMLRGGGRNAREELNGARVVAAVRYRR